jgi:hypothetical protein
MKHLHDFLCPIYSFDPKPDTDEYNLEEVSPRIRQKLCDFVNSVQDSNNHQLLYRGDALSAQIYQLFKGINLAKFFVVGEKAKSNADEAGRTFLHYELPDASLIQEIRELITICNTEIDKHKKRRKGTAINGHIPIEITDVLQNTDAKTLNRFKLILLSLLHNKGDDDYYKEKSPFLSLTSRFETAIKFSDRGDNRFVFLYILNKGNKLYYTARRLRNYLKSRFNVSWYKDIHSEYLILGAMYPDKLVGFYEIKDDAPISFILNPWFKGYLSSDEFNEIDEVEVIQSSFHKYAKDLCWDRYVLRPDAVGLEQYVAGVHELQAKVMSYTF